MSNLYEIITLFDSYVLYKFINLVRINMKIPDCAGRKCTDRRMAQGFFYCAGRKSRTDIRVVIWWS